MGIRQRRTGRFQPFPTGSADEVAQQFQRPPMIAIQPVTFRLRQHLRAYEPPIDGHVGQCPEAQHFAHIAFGQSRHGLDDGQILYPNTERARPVITGFDRQDHSRFQRHVAGSRKRRWALVNAEIRSNPMPRSMIVVLPRKPKRHPRHRVQVAPGQPLRPVRTRHGDQALQHTGKPALLFHTGVSGANRASYVRRSIPVLTAAVDQQEFAGPNRTIAFPGHTVMGDRAIRPCAANRVEGDFRKSIRRTAEFLQPFDDIYFGQCSELCGKDHAYMPITVKVVNQDEYDAWLVRAREQFAGIPRPFAVASN